MVVSDKKILYVNITFIIYALFTLLVSAHSIFTIYENLVKKSIDIEKEYNKVVDQYKRAIVFILNNASIKNLHYFNAFTSITYDLPFVKKFEVIKSDNSTVSNDNNDKITSNQDLVPIVGCHNTSCIRIAVNKDALLTKVLKEAVGEYGKILTIPPSKLNLLGISISIFLEAHKIFLFLNLLCLLILYLFHLPFLIIKNIKLNKTCNSLSNITTKIKNNLDNLTTEQEEFYDSMVCMQDLIDDYFTYYAHQLVIRETYIEDTDIILILHKTERFFKYQTYKKDLKFIFNYLESSYIIQSDKEIFFIILLNLIFRALYRSPASSEIIINITKTKDTINIEINDNGYIYKQKPSRKIHVFEIPGTLLDNLCQKIQLEFKESKEAEINIISLKVTQDFKTGAATNHNNIISFNPYDKKS